MVRPVTTAFLALGILAGGVIASSTGLSQAAALPGAGISAIIGGIFKARANYFQKHTDKTNANVKVINANKRADNSFKAARFLLWGLIPVLGTPIGTLMEILPPATSSVVEDQ